ncbi:MAG: peptidase M1 [Acidobacteria bacterium]|nr:peptidase M1 [Acidobacteriota bacterium]
MFRLLILSLPMMVFAQELVQPQAGVSRELARLRAAQLADVRYGLQFTLAPKTEAIKGSARITFTLKDVQQPVVLDFRDLDGEGRIGNVTINAQAVSDAQQLNGHIILAARHFKTGANEIKLEFTTGASAAGRPLIRYLDKDDGSEFVYTLFVPMDASMAFPCFDQPDVKARFQLSLTVPNGWKAVSNTPSMKQDAQTIQFGETQPISTYLFAFAAGPFQTLDVTGNQSLPMQFYFRPSQRTRAAQEIPAVAELTRDGVKHFEQFFGHRFPFSKYDQVLLPGFAYGGMEHAGATFLREDAILFRTTPAQSDKLGRASLVLHELAHQWFGDLVTMRWFDDLWLKEGFANYMATHAIAALKVEGLEARSAWQRFYLGHKPLAYGIDGTRGTTPIWQDIPNLKDAKSAYGAIVYQKAPSLLHTLSFVVGEEKFQAGVQGFVQRHAYANAEWSDLVRAMEEASGQKLTVWADAWIKQRGMPEVTVEWACDAKGLIETLRLKQSDTQRAKQLWPIKTQVLLAYADGFEDRVTAEFVTATHEVKAAKGKPCPTYVFTNADDYGYGRFLLDGHSTLAVLKRVSLTRDPLMRAMLWGALWEGVRNAQLTPFAFLNAALEALPQEQDELLIGSLLNQVAHAYTRYLTPRQREMMAYRPEELCAKQMTEAESLGVRIHYFRALRAMAASEPARQVLKDLLAGKRTIAGLEIKPLDRWRIIAVLLAQKDAEAETLLAAEIKRDTTDDGRKQAWITAAARAEAVTKARYFNDYLTNKSVAEDWIEGSLSNFNSFGQSELTQPYLSKALAALPQQKRDRKIFFVLAWLNAFIGGQHSPQALSEVQRWLREAKPEPDLERKVLEITDELERIVKIRKAFENRR